MNSINSKIKGYISYNCAGHRGLSQRIVSLSWGQQEVRKGFVEQVVVLTLTEYKEDEFKGG